MKSIIVQFHITHEEIANFLVNIARELHLHFVLSRSKAQIPPKEIAFEDIHNVIFENSAVEYTQIIVLPDKPEIDSNGNFLHIDPCEGAIEFTIGALSPQSLMQSSFSVKTNDQRLLALAKTIASKLKKLTKAGTTAAIDENIIYRTDRYTEKAKELQNRGLKMMPFAGVCELMLGIEKKNT